MPNTNKPHRDTIFLEQARIISHDSFQGEQHLLRLEAPECAHHALPGNFAHLQCNPLRPLRRPISIMRTSTTDGWVDLLYKAVGEGTRLLTTRRPGESISLLGPIGNPFHLHAERPRPLLIGGGVGMPPMIFLADTLRYNEQIRPFVILGSEVPFPFQLRPSEILIPSVPDGVIAGMPLLEEWGIANRLASMQDFAGCFQGYVTDLARYWLDSMDDKMHQEIEVLACGPHPMLQAVSDLCREYSLPCQVSLEEFMACGIGGCAGCVVPVETGAGQVMKRVCVDGPVFDAKEVFK